LLYLTTINRGKRSDNNKNPQTLFHLLNGLLVGLLLSCVFVSENTHANPVLGNVAAGNVSVQQVPNSTVIHQQSSQAIINWKSFNIGKQEVTHFDQPRGGVTLNRIDPTQGASAIYGRLTATGQIILVNPAGVYFGPGSYVNVGGLIASTSNISDQDFLKGYYHFTADPAFSGSVINDGRIVAAKNGLVALIGGEVRNNGYIEANMGTVVLASGSTATMSFAGNDMVSFSVDGHTVKGVTNTGTIKADGGTVLVTTAAAQSTLDNVINLKGIVQANSVRSSHGEIIIGGGSGGVVRISANISATGKHKGTSGGNVTVTGSNILVDSSSVIDVSGDTGGGKILLGGNYQGKGPLPNANAVYIAPSASLRADAYTSGNGGTIIVWSDYSTKAYGSLSAQGGAASGNGGFIETSSHGYLDVNSIAINMSAPHGAMGTWLLDPANLTISSAANASVSAASPFTPTATASVLNIGTLTTALASANVVVQTGNNAFAGNGDIIIANAISYNSKYSLTLSAYRTISSTLGGAVINNAGTGAVNLIADNTGTGVGTVSFTGAGANVTASGGVSVFYNPTVFGTPNTIYSGGTAPIAYMLVNNLTKLQAMNNNLSGNYALSININAAAISNFVPIGNATTPFSGNFNGQGYTISNLTINLPNASNVGLFGYTALSSNISNINVSGSFTGMTYVGALVGNNYAYITNASSSGTVTGSSGAVDVGGLIGINNNAVFGGYSTANITAGAGAVNVGGFIGYNQAYLTNVYSTGSVTAGTGSTNIGGLLGINFRPVLTSYSSSLVNAPNASNVGGLIGNNNANIQNVNASGGIIAGTSTNVGGLIGINYGNVTNSLVLAAISSPGSTNVGGMVGNNLKGVFNSYWDTDVTGLSNAVGAGSSTGMTGGCFGATCSNGGTVQLTSSSTYDSWNFSSTWGVLPGLSYPYLLVFNPVPPRVITGNSPPSSGSLANLMANGVPIGTVQTGANGSFYFFEPNGVVADSSKILVYLSGSSLKGNVAAIAPNGGLSMSDLTIFANTLNIGQNNTPSTMSNAILATAAGSVSNPNILYSVSGGNLTLASGVNLNVTLPTTYLLDGNITATSGNLVFNGPVSISAANAILTTTTAGDINMSGNINGNNHGFTVNNAGINSTILGVMSGLTSFTKGGSGVLRLTGINTYTGPTILNGGKLSISADSALGAAPATATAGQLVFNGGTLQVTSPLLTINANRGVLFNAGGGGFQIDSGTTTYAGIIAGVGALSKTGVGTLVLGGTNTYSGGTNVIAGILQTSNSKGFGTGAITISVGAALYLTNSITVANAITVNGTGINNAGAIVASGADILSGIVTVGSNSTVGVVASTDKLTLTGSITYTGTGTTLVKNGSGTLVLPSTGTGGTGGGGTGGGTGCGGDKSGCGHDDDDDHHGDHDGDHHDGHDNHDDDHHDNDHHDNDHHDNDRDGHDDNHDRH